MKRIMAGVSLALLIGVGSLISGEKSNPAKTDCCPMAKAAAGAMDKASCDKAKDAGACPMSAAVEKPACCPAEAKGKVAASANGEMGACPMSASAKGKVAAKTSKATGKCPFTVSQERAEKNNKGKI